MNSFNKSGFVNKACARFSPLGAMTFTRKNTNLREHFVESDAGVRKTRFKTAFAVFHLLNQHVLHALTCCVVHQTTLRQQSKERRGRKCGSAMKKPAADWFELVSELRVEFRYLWTLFFNLFLVGVGCSHPQPSNPAVVQPGLPQHRRNGCGPKPADYDR